MRMLRRAGVNWQKKDGRPHMRRAGGINLHQLTHQPHTPTHTPGAASDPPVRSVYTALDQRTTGRTHARKAEARSAKTRILLSAYYGFQTRFKINHFPDVNASDNTFNTHQSWKMLPLMVRIKWLSLMTNSVGWRVGEKHTHYKYIYVPRRD